MATEDYNDDRDFSREVADRTDFDLKGHAEAVHYEYNCSHCRAFGTNNWLILLAHYDNCEAIKRARELL